MTVLASCTGELTVSPQVPAACRRAARGVCSDSIPSSPCLPKMPHSALQGPDCTLVGSKATLPPEMHSFLPDSFAFLLAVSLLSEQCSLRIYN